MNSHKKISLIIGILVIIIGFVIVYVQNSQRNSYRPINSVPLERLNPGTTDINTSSTTTSNAKQYTLADVAVHNSQSSCWSAVNGGVYDLTPWISQHPGGSQAILSMCGKDGSAGFNGQHGGQRRPANELAGFKIGDLIQAQ